MVPDTLNFWVWHHPKNVGPPEPGARGTGRPLAPPIFGFDESKTFCPIIFYNCKAQLLLAPPNILTFPRVCSAVAYCHTIKFVNIPFLDKVVKITILQVTTIHFKQVAIVFSMKKKNELIKDWVLLLGGPNKRVYSIIIFMG